VGDLGVGIVDGGEFTVEVTRAHVAVFHLLVQRILHTLHILVQQRQGDDGHKGGDQTVDDRSVRNATSATNLIGLRLGNVVVIHLQNRTID
jgi:hypothetical protein